MPCVNFLQRRATPLTRCLGAHVERSFANTIKGLKESNRYQADYDVSDQVITVDEYEQRFGRRPLGL